MTRQRRHRRILVKRDTTAAVERSETVEREAQFLELEEPQFLSIVKSPANRTGFKILRDDGQETPRRRQRSDSSLMSLTLPADTTEEEAQELFERFSLDEDIYEIARDEDGVYLKRIQLDDTIETRQIHLPNNVIANVSVAVFDRNIIRGDDQPSLTVTKVCFKQMERADVEAWLTDKGIAFNEEDLFKLGEEFICVRHDTPDAAVIRSIDLEKNITAVVTQTQCDDIPQRIYRGIIEEAYGNYGWGHLDFIQAMADEIFSYDSANAIYWLWDVLDNIIFYSDLSLEDRLALMQNATGEFLAWMSSLMQALPRSILSPEDRVNLNSQSTGDEETDEGESNDSSTETKETAEMVVKDKDKTKTDESGKTSTDDTVKRDDQGNIITEGAEQEQAADEVTNAQRSDSDDGSEAGEESTDDEVINITRGDLNKRLSTEAVDEIVEEQNAKRSAEGGNTAVLEAIADMGTTLTQRMDKQDDKIAAIGGETIVRSDSDDGDGADGDDSDDDEVQRNDPYRGSIFGKKVADRLYNQG